MRLWRVITGRPRPWEPFPWLGMLGLVILVTMAIALAIGSLGALGTGEPSR